MEQVIATVELLELILVEVDLQTILTSANRVCRYWNHVIRNSPQLQTLLFFRPESLPRDRRPNRIEARMNPLLLRNFEGLLMSTSDRNCLIEAEVVKIQRPEASWRNMLVQQPPVQTLGVWKVEMGCYLEQGYENKTHTRDFDAKGGLRMDDLVEYASGLERGYTWNLPFWGEEGTTRWEKEKRSLFFRKAKLSERTSILKLWDDSDLVIKLTRWSGAR